MKVALVHDYLNQYGGAERVLEAFCEIWPSAPIFTLVYDAKRTGGAFESRNIKTSWLQKIPGVKKEHRPFLMLMPFAIEKFDLSKYDLIISDSASFAKGVIAPFKARHISYCHTPTRYVWDDSHKYISEFSYSGLIKQAVPFFLNYLRLWDEAAAARPDKYIANSRFVAERMKKYYKCQPQVIYPPVKVRNFHIAPRCDDYFLLVARFLSYKKIDLAIEAFNRLGRRLKIVGDGRERKTLKKIAGPTIEFEGLVSEKKLAELYAKCQALIFPQEEDFGIAAVEAMAAGRPVIAFASGGALEIVKEGKTGLFFKEQTIDSLIEAVNRFRPNNFSPEDIREEAMKYDKELFKREIIDFVENAISNRK